MVENLNDAYALRGHRVSMLTPDRIIEIAQKSIRALNITKHDTRNMAEFIERLWNTHKINVEIAENSDWLDVADAVCHPESFTIGMPEHFFKKLCKGDKPSLGIFFHELGHLLLGHKPLLHHSSTLATEYEDAEWQADFFSDVIREMINKNDKEAKIGQLKFSFE